MEPNTMPNQHTTERAFAPATEQLPRNMGVERLGGLSSGVTREYPEVRGGICSYCGVIDGNYASEYQYKLCNHYRGLQLACSYCPATKDVDQVITHSVLRVLEHPDKPGTLIVHCNAYECLKKHEERWKVSN